MFMWLLFEDKIETDGLDEHAGDGQAVTISRHGQQFQADDMWSKYLPESNLLARRSRQGST